jgi:hypothetical protein
MVAEAIPNLNFLFPSLHGARQNIYIKKLERNAIIDKISVMNFNFFFPSLMAEDSESLGFWTLSIIRYSKN